MISILAGQADGSLGAPVNFPVQIGPVSMVVADMNHDGKKDIAVVNSGSNSVTVLVNASQ